MSALNGVTAAAGLTARDRQGSNHDEFATQATHRPAVATHYRKTNRRQAPKPAVLPEPIEVAKFFANRKGDVVIVSLREFEGMPLLDIRKHYADGSGFLRPTRKGIAVVIRRLPDLAAAIMKAEKTARELGLLGAAQ